jgi:hypothetical protein
VSPSLLFFFSFGNVTDALCPLRTGGKGTVRRKIVRKPKPTNSQDDKKLQGALKKLNVQPIAGVEEVNMFREDGNVLHFSAPKGECDVYLPQLPTSPPISLFLSLSLFSRDIVDVFVWMYADPVCICVCATTR